MLTSTLLIFIPTNNKFELKETDNSFQTLREEKNK